MRATYAAAALLFNMKLDLDIGAVIMENVKILQQLKHGKTLKDFMNATTFKNFVYIIKNRVL